MIIRSLVILLHVGGMIAAMQKCSEFCVCDKLEGLRRAACTHQHLVNVVPVQRVVDILDLSFNNIGMINDNTFQEQYSSLKQLNFSRNHIQHIAMKGLSGLKKLQLLDLSFNHIKYLLDGTFLATPQLETLILTGNDFSRTKSGPLLEAASLKALYIGQCKIDHLRQDTFKKVPNLLGLDLSGNYLAQLDIEVVSILPNLEKINLSRNRWHCNNKTKEMTTWLTERNIDYVPICLDHEELSTDKGDFDIKPPFDDVETIPGLDSWPEEDKDEDMNGKLRIQNENKPIYILQEKFKCFFYITHLFDAIPSFWAFMMGLQVGTVIAIFGTLLVLNVCRRDPRPRSPARRRWSLRHSVYMRSRGNNSTPWTELQSLDCPDTPPPPYKDINVPRNNVQTNT